MFILLIKETCLNFFEISIIKFYVYGIMLRFLNIIFLNNLCMKTHMTSIMRCFGVLFSLHISVLFWRKKCGCIFLYKKTVK